MELKKIQTLRFPVTGDKIPIKWLFAPFIIMMLALVARSAVSAISLVRQVKYAGSSSEQRTQ
jgi:C4-dicarboxylate transporter DctQ subunit